MMLCGDDTNADNITAVDDDNCVVNDIVPRWCYCWYYNTADNITGADVDDIADDITSFDDIGDALKL